MNWERMKNSPATRGFRTVADFTGFLLKATFKPAFMSHAQNPKENGLNFMAKLQVARLLISVYPFLLSGLSGVGFYEYNGQLNPQSVAFTLGVAFLGAGLVDMAGLGLQAIGEKRKKRK